MLMFVTILLHVFLLVTGQMLDSYKSLTYNSLENPTHQKRLTGPLGIREKRSSENFITECMEVKSEEGQYFFKATKNDNNVCGIYFFTEPDQTVEIYFNYFDVPCENGGLVSIIDGWELNGEFFPSPTDHPKPMESRYTEICGRKKFKKIFRSSQNAAVIQYRVPKKGGSFSFIVQYPKNRMPCNVLLHNSENVFTLRNYGKQINCSISAAFPAVAKVLSMNIGFSGFLRGLELETGTIHKCRKRGMNDYIEIGGANGLDTSKMFVSESLCGVDSKPGIDQAIFCGFTTVRLVSSGAFDNSATILFRKAEETDVSPLATICDIDI